MRVIHNNLVMTNLDYANQVRKILGIKPITKEEDTAKSNGHDLNLGIENSRLKDEVAYLRRLLRDLEKSKSIKKGKR